MGSNLPYKIRHVQKLLPRDEMAANLAGFPEKRRAGSGGGGEETESCFEY